VYTNGEPITAELKRDPEFGDWYVDVHVTLHDEEEPETAAQKDEACILKWAPQVAPDLRGLLHFSSSWAS
jgi:hypothetical protein